MKKQILILISLIVITSGFFLLTNVSNSSSGTLFEREAASFESPEITSEDESEAVETEKEPVLNGMVFVDVQGEVVNPGVFEVSSEVRVGYLIEMAGGLTAEANVRGLNQAARIYDEMVILVPHVDDLIEIETHENSRTKEVESEAPELISLSTASALELQSLPGIGPALSANIIAHREGNGAFSTIDELVNVAGIGTRIVENLRELVKP